MPLPCWILIVNLSAIGICALKILNMRIIGLIVDKLKNGHYIRESTCITIIHGLISGFQCFTKGKQINQPDQLMLVITCRLG
mmetsp:Transcript_10527/g.13748  ORF Transcript_10527/g.13748 Transcript_10527/m.13748 type:complete len:82 (-) Transcript_10527:363-608(-)